MSSSRRPSLKLESSCACELAELFAFRVLREDSELRLGGPQRHLLAGEGQPCSEERVREVVLTRGELGVDDPALARLAQPVEALGLVRLGRGGLGRAQRVQLVAGEQIGVPRDDRRLLGRLLLADANRPFLIGRFGVVRPVGVLVLRRAANRGRAHLWARALARSQTVVMSSSNSNGFGRIASAWLSCASCLASAEPETITTEIGGSRSWHSAMSASLRSPYRWTSRRTTSTSSVSQRRPGRRKRVGLEDLVSLELEIDPAEQPDRRLVVDDENPRRGRMPLGVVHRANISSEGPVRNRGRRAVVRPLKWQGTSRSPHPAGAASRAPTSPVCLCRPGASGAGRGSRSSAPSIHSLRRGRCRRLPLRRGRPAARRRPSVVSRPSSSMLSNRPGETFEPVTATRIG